MRTLVLIVCAAGCITATGCKNRWEFKWPGRGATTATTRPSNDVKTKAAATQPTESSAVTPRQEIAQLQRQIKTLRERLDFLEDENAKLRNSNKPDKSLEEIQKALKEQTFIAKMQAEDLKILKTVAVERDLYKTRSERLEREAKVLNARIAKLEGKPEAKDTDAIREKAPATKPAGR